MGVDAPGNATALARRGDPASVCALAPNHDFSIRELVEPAFASGWTDATVPTRYSRGSGPRRRGIGREASVIGLTRGGSARAYPLAVVAAHEVVNDSFDGPVLVTYCPRCRSGMTAERRVKGSPTTFHVSGHLWRTDGSDENLVLYDRATGSYWSQILTTALCGPVAGSALELLPSSFTTWGEWLDAHPETEVLLPPPASTTA